MISSNWTERDVEDQICDNPRGVWDYPHVAVVGRQITLPNNTRLDVLLVSLDGDGEWRWIVVEVKRDRVGTDALDQVLGYMYELERVLYEGARVCGLLVGQEFDTSLLRIGRAVPGVYFAPYFATLHFASAAIDHEYSIGEFIPEHRVAYGAYSEEDDAFLTSFAPQANAVRRSIKSTIARRMPVRLTDCPAPPERRLKVV